jgi:hypothetical protein
MNNEEEARTHEAYYKIAAMWGLPGSRRLVRILKAGFTGEVMLQQVSIL